jgi:hypothetical protein
MNPIRATELTGHGVRLEPLEARHERDLDIAAADGSLREFASQRAIAALGAHKDGLIRHFSTRRDGSARNVVMYSVLLSEWAEVKHHLMRRLARHGSPP